MTNWRSPAAYLLLWVCLFCRNVEFCSSLNGEGISHLIVKEEAKEDPVGTLSNQKNTYDTNLCFLFRVSCSNARVLSLNIKAEAPLSSLPKQHPPPKGGKKAPSSTDTSKKHNSSTDTSKKHNSSTDTSKKHNPTIIYASVAAVFCCLIALFAFLIFRQAKKGVSVMPWRIDSSGQLQKACITGVPLFRRSELETASEGFSNIIGNLSNCSLYKGTLSNGVEIAVTSTMIKSPVEWTNQYEDQFEKKISMMSAINHKNFLKLIGYCKEEDPFTRMMVFEYAPNGTLFEHLHIKEAEQLDWLTRLRISMGIVYCLEYMEQLNPPANVRSLNSSSIYLSEDYAAKISDVEFWDEEGKGTSTSGIFEQECIIYKFGIILLEIISGRLPFSEDDGLLVLWASSYLKGTRPLKDMVDATLKSVPEEHITALVEVIRSCINKDPKRRPKTSEVAEQMRLITGISQDGASPRISPLLWAELEIISA